MTTLGSKGPDAYRMQVALEKYLPGIEVEQSHVNSSVFHLQIREPALTEGLRQLARFDECLARQEDDGARP